MGKQAVTRAELIEALIDCVNQACQESYTPGCVIVDHGCISSYKDALWLLEKLGYARDIGRRRYELYWEPQGTGEVRSARKGI